jgi:hypothetical protein
LGPNYAIEREPKRYINELIVETEVTLCQLDPKLQNTYQHLTAKQIKHILATNRYNVFHKHQQHNMNQIKKILENNNLTIVKADKPKSIVIINKEKLNNKVNNFIKENHIIRTQLRHIKNKLMKQSKNAIH